MKKHVKYPMYYRVVSQFFLLLFLTFTLFPCDGLVFGKADSVCQQVMDAARKGDLNEMKTLLKKNGVNTADDFGRTPLMISAIFGQFKIAEFLIENGADENGIDSRGFTPLMYAAGFSHILKSYGLFTGMRETQAMFTLKGRLKVFEMLLDRSANPDIVSKDGEDIFSIAKKDMNDDFNKILKKKWSNSDNPWEDVWKNTTQKIDSGELAVSDDLIEVRETVFSIGDFEENDGKKYRTLKVHVTEKERSVPGTEMSVSSWGERWMKFDKNVSLLLFEYYGDDGQVNAGLVEADPETKEVNIRALTVNPGDDEDIISDLIFVLSKNYVSTAAEFKMKRTENGWIFMLKHSSGVDGMELMGMEMDSLRKKR